MIMVDTNILIDLRERDRVWYEWSLGSLIDARAAGIVAASAAVVGELATRGASLRDLRGLFRDYRIRVEPIGIEAAYAAGQAQCVYRATGGKREKLLADFLIGGHALIAKATLLTRDARRYRTYFPDLPLITPETDNG
jgi:predicted nucleic acid-binding protein